MINRIYNDTYEVSCDFCDEVTEYTVESWDELMREMEAYGWISKKTNGGWEHLCPNCQAE